MGLIASLTIAVTAAIGSGENFYQAESWSEPTREELVTCAQMAADLNSGFDYLIRQGLNKDWQSKTATCELIPTEDTDGKAAPAKAPAPARVSFTF
jgi:hypothetical protein